MTTAKAFKRAAALAALLAVALMAVALAGCGKKSSSSSVPPQQRVQTALANAAKIKSGKSSIDGTIALGSVPGTLQVTGGGPFDTEAKGGGAADITLSINIAGRNQSIGFVSVDGKSYLTLGGKAFENKQGSANGGIEPGAVSSLLTSLSDYATDVKSTGTKTVDGQKLDMYSFKVDLKALANKDLSKGSTGDVSIPGLGSLKSMAQNIGSADMTLGVGSDDLPHQFGADVAFGPTGQQNGGLKGTLTVTDINQPQTIEKPKNVVSGSDALGALGGFLGGIGGQ